MTNHSVPSDTAESEPLGETRSWKLEWAVTAVVRAGLAWSARHRHPLAWREVARMTGVIMACTPPDHGHTTPMGLIERLRQPLGTWLPLAVDDSELAGLVVLDGDDVRDEVVDIGHDYIGDLFAKRLDHAADWLPGWSVHRAEQIERETFANIRQAEVYSVARRFVIDHAAGYLEDVREARQEHGFPVLTSFLDIPDDRQFRQQWWWPCPECEWPMRVQDRAVWCTFLPHRASYVIVPDAKQPRLQPRPGAPKRRPVRHQVKGAVCVHEGVWRCIVVPGRVEVRLFDALADLEGVQAELYPQRDAYDVGVSSTDRGRSGGPRWQMRIEVKDYSSPRKLAARLAAKPPAAENLVIPEYRRHQLGLLEDELERVGIDWLSVYSEKRITEKVKRKRTNTRSEGNQHR